MQSGEASGVKGLPGLICAALLLCLSACSLTAPAAKEPTPQFAGPPQIRITSPLPNQTFLAGAAVIVQARVDNAGPDLARVSVLIDSAVIGDVLDPNPTGAASLPISLDWLTSSPGRFDIAVSAERADGSGASESVAISVLLPATEAPSQDEAAVLPVNPPQPASTPTPPPASQPITAGHTVNALVAQPSNLRRGPGTSFALIGSISVNQQVEIVAVNPARDWYHIRYGELGDAWIYSALLSLDGDTAGLPVETGPAPPQPPTNAPAAAMVNLVIADITLSPENLKCDEPGAVLLSIRNDGAANSETGGWIALQDTVPARDSKLVAQLDQIPFPTIAPGETFTASIPITVSAHYEETHRITVAIDSGGHIVEADENDNSAAIDYILSRESCP